MNYQVNVFQPYVSKVKFLIPSIDQERGGYHLQVGEPVEFDGEALRLQDGRTFKVPQIRGAIDRGWVVARGADTQPDMSTQIRNVRKPVQEGLQVEYQHVRVEESDYQDLGDPNSQNRGAPDGDILDIVNELDKVANKEGFGKKMKVVLQREEDLGVVVGSIATQEPTEVHFGTTGKAKLNIGEKQVVEKKSTFRNEIKYHEDNMVVPSREIDNTTVRGGHPKAVEVGSIQTEGIRMSKTAQVGDQSKPTSLEVVQAEDNVVSPARPRDGQVVYRAKTPVKTKLTVDGKSTIPSPEAAYDQALSAVSKKVHTSVPENHILRGAGIDAVGEVPPVKTKIHHSAD